MTAHQLFPDRQPSSEELRGLFMKVAPVDYLYGNKPTLSQLARAMGVTRISIQNWIKAKKIPQERVPRLLEIGDGRLTLDELLPYIV